MSEPIFARVALPLPFEPFDYLVPTHLDLKPGDWVHVPFRKGLTTGIVWDLPTSTTVPVSKLRPIVEKASIAPLDAPTRAFLAWVGQYTLSPLGAVIKMCLVDASYPWAADIYEPPQLYFHPPTLNPDQRRVADTLRSARGYGVHVLQGVTGSGKTEVYFEAIAEALNQGHQTLVLVPEITLTTQWIDRFKARFGAAPVLWHSDLSPAHRRKAWQAVQTGNAPMVVGARSALFLPFPNLGLIVVDEEHDPSYKQETQVPYHARDMAVVRARYSGCPLILASATPSLETHHNIETHHYDHHPLPERYGNAQMPEITLVDMRRADLLPGTFISKTLWQALETTIGRGEQALLFLNRRGFAPVFLCRTCGHTQDCDHCAVHLVYHKRTHKLLCHHCGLEKAPPITCPTCGPQSDFLTQGPGVERLFEDVTNKHPTWRVLVMTSDTLTTPKKRREKMAAIEQGDVDVIIGTQTMAKGHHFVNLTLVGVVDGDLGRTGVDIRGNERMYQLLTQVAGRAGRGNKPGHVVVQTYDPEHTVLTALLKGEPDKFLTLEKKEREAFRMPPYGRLSAVIVSTTNEALGRDFVQQMAKHFPNDKGARLLGPAPAPIFYLKKKYRWRFLIISDKRTLHQPLLSAWVASVPTPTDITIHIDIDPYSFL